ncbi:MAG: protein SCO1/2 [Rhodothermales bacterium]|jgi:protein SCO1/2
MIRTCSRALALAFLTVLLPSCGGPAPSDASTAATGDAVDHAAHDAMSTVLEADVPALAEMSLYQVDTPWMNQRGEAVQLSGMAGRIQLLAMTYTSCEVSCPVIVADLKRIEATLAEDGLQAGFVLLSLDPDRDSPATLATFAEKGHLSDNWTLLTAPADDVREMAALLGVRYRKMQNGDFAHTNLISVLDAEGVLVHQQKGLGPDLTKGTVAFLWGM